MYSLSVEPILRYILAYKKFLMIYSCMGFLAELAERQ